MKDRIPGAPGQFNATVTGSQLQKLQRGEPFTITLKRDDQPIVEGTPYSKAAVLPDTLAGRLCPDIEDPTPADAFSSLADKISNKPERVIATPATLKDILSSARAGTTVELTPGDYPRLNLVGIHAYPENLTITGTQDAKIAGVSITSGIKDQEINSGHPRDASIRGCQNADVSNATLPQGLTFQGVCFTDSFSLRNGSIDNLTFDSCLFVNGAFINIDPNRMDDLYGDDFYEYDKNGDPKANFYTRPFYAKLLPKNIVVRNNTFRGVHPTSDLSAIRIQTADGIVVYKNTVGDTEENTAEVSRRNGVNIGGVAGSNFEHYATGKISITNNLIRNTASRSMRLYAIKDAEIFIAANSMYSANKDAAEKSNPEVIKISECRNTTITIPDGKIDGNYYGGNQIAVGNKITLQECALPVFESKEHPGSYLHKTNVGESSPNEWFNPPMIAGEEYRTTERYNGKPVFTAMLQLGKMPHDTVKRVANELVMKAQNLVDIEVRMYRGDDGAAMKLSYGGEPRFFVEFADHLMYIVLTEFTEALLHNYMAEAVIKYTKG